MLFFIAGASGSGKTSCIPLLKKLLPEATIADFDDIGVPENPDKQWRQAATEKWLQRYLSEVNKHSIFCICGQVVLGEILACPSAKQVCKINLCLLDVSDIERIKRLKQRNTYGADQNMLNWAAWLRMHHTNPQWHQSVIKEDAWKQLDSSCWDTATNWDRLANVTKLDNTHLTLEQTSNAINHWIESIRQIKGAY